MDSKVFNCRRRAGGAGAARARGGGVGRGRRAGVGGGRRAGGRARAAARLRARGARARAAGLRAQGRAAALRVLCCWEIIFVAINTLFFLNIQPDLWQNAELVDDEAVSAMWHFLALSKSLVEDGEYLGGTSF